MNKPKLMVVGHARHGKDTACSILKEDFKYSFTSSSNLALNIFLFNKLKHRYKTKEECFNDRHNHRKEWYDLIADFNSKDPSRLIKEVFKQTDIYCGLRSRKEFLAGKKEKIFKYSLWIDAEKRLNRENSSSMTIEKSDVDFIVCNNGTIDDLREKLSTLMTLLIR